jgi:hypothetical protein
MATLTGEQLKDSYQSLVTIGDSITSNPTSGALENGKGTLLTAVGIGTNSPSGIGDALIEVFNGTDTQLTLRNNNNFGTIFNGNTVGDPTSIFSNVGFKFAIADDKNATNFSEKMRIKSSGDISFRDTSANEAFYWDASTARLGLGTTLPTEKLQIVDSANDIQVRLGSGNAGINPTLRFHGKNTANTTNVYADIRVNPDNQTLGFSGTGTSGGSIEQDALVIDSSGNVGIGTDSPSAGAVGGKVVHVQNSGGTASVRVDRSDASTAGTISMTSGNTTNSLYATGTKPTTFHTNSTEAMRIDSSGNVGINNTSPSSFLSNGRELVLGDGSASHGMTIFSDSAGTGNLFFADGTTGDQAYRGFLRYAHSSDSMEFYTAGAVLRMTIDSSGNVGIGTDSPTSISGYTGATLNNSTNGGFIDLQSNGATAFRFLTNGSVNNIETRTATPIVFLTNTTEAMRIDSSGNVGIGTTSPSVPLEVDVSGTSDVFKLTRDTGANGELNIDFAGANANFNSEQGGYTFTTSTVSNAVSIDSSGNVLVGTTANPLAGQLHSNASGTNFVLYTSGVNWASINNHTNSGTQYFQDFRYNGTQIGSILGSNTSTAYNTSSDYRLKENVVEMTGALDRVDQLNPSRFNFIADADTTVDGFLAHEVADVVPEAITGEKDAVDDEGNPIYQGIDQSKLVPLLVGAIQELRAEIEQLKNQ